MLKCKALDKLKDKNGITVGYVLTDGHTIMNVKSADIKKAILNGQVEIENIQLSDSGRLVKKSNLKSTQASRKKYNKLSYLKQIKINKNTQRGYTNYSDVYDFHSPKQPFEYNLPIIDYEGYIKDKKNNIYMIKAQYRSGDSGRIAGGASDYTVNIQYNNEVITLKGHSSAFGSYYGTSIIIDLESGYYLEDYLMKELSKNASINNMELVNSIIKNNEYNPESEKDKQARLEQEEQDKFKGRYKKIRFNDIIIITKTDTGYKHIDWDKVIDVNTEIQAILKDRHPEVKTNEAIAVRINGHGKNWVVDSETNQVLIVDYRECKMVEQQFYSKTILKMLEDTDNRYKDYLLRHENICITGKLKYFKNRQQLIKFINDNEMYYTDKVDSRLDYIVTNDINSNSSKLTKVKEYNKDKYDSRDKIGILTEERFIALARKIED